MSLSRPPASVEELSRELDTPVATHVLRRGRYLVGLAVAAGAFALMSHGDVAAAEEYTIAKGDTLSHIAAARGVSVSAIVSANGLASEHSIVAGETLTIPARGSSAAPTAGSSYTIAKGDTLSHIAAARGVSVSAIVSANGLASEHSIVAGETLTIPARGSSAAPTAGSSSAAATPTGNLPENLAASSQRKGLQKYFSAASQSYGIPGDLLPALAWQESGWNNDMISNVGARGVGQLMPDTVDFVNENLVSTPLDPAVPEQNIKMSAAYMRYLLDQTGGDSTSALAAYYQGLGALQRDGIYEETHQYIRSVRALQNSYFG